MSRRPVRFGAVLLLLTSGCASAPRPPPTAHVTTSGTLTTRVEAGAAGGHPFLTPPEMVARMEASPVQYRIHTLEDLKGLAPEQLTDFVWPQRTEALDFPVVVAGEGGTRSVRAASFDPAAVALLEQAEVHYRAKRYAEAERLYAQALVKEPGNYLATLNLGDVALFSGDAKAALARYEQATRLNPDDHRSYFFRATALGRLGRFTEVRDMYARALALRPEHPYVMSAVTGNAETLGIDLQPRVLRPRALARRDGEAIDVYAEGAPWLAFGICKALWLGEPSHRKEMTGTEQHQTFSSTEERECLASLIVMYRLRREDGKARDPALERLSRIAEDGYLTELVLYEVAARAWPHVGLTLPDAQRERLHQYVLRYVLPLTRYTSQ